MIIEHDGDGKLYYYHNGKLHWLIEVEIYEGDKIRDAINMLLCEVKMVTKRFQIVRCTCGSIVAACITPATVK